MNPAILHINYRSYNLSSMGIIFSMENCLTDSLPFLIRYPVILSSVKSFKSFLKSITPWIVLYLYRKIRSLPEDSPTIIKFITTQTKTKTTFFKRFKLVLKFYRISYSVECPHSEGEMIRVVTAILSRKPSERSVLVEAGSYKGGSTAKLSLAARLAGKRLFVFDSFEGIPENQEQHGKNIFGGVAYFNKGDYARVRR